MAITSTQINGKTHQNYASGSFVDSAASPAAAALVLGFTPRYVRWLNATDRIAYEWHDGMAAGTTLKTAANGVRTLDTADVAVSVSGGTTTIGAAAIIQNKVNYWEARD